jgi:hypothetical protein
LEANQQHGDLVVDEIPGLAYALSRRTVELSLDVRLSDGTALGLSTTVPEPVAALSIKALAYRSRLSRSDALDTWRLLEVAYAAGIRADEWPMSALLGMQQEFSTNSSTSRQRVASRMSLRTSPYERACEHWLRRLSNKANVCRQTLACRQELDGSAGLLAGWAGAGSNRRPSAFQALLSQAW